MKIGMVIPWSSPFVWTRFVEASWKVKPPHGVDLDWYIGRGWSPAARHIKGCYQAIKGGADYLCIFGADQVPPPDLIQRLWGHVLRGYPVIAALVPTRGYFAHNTGTKPFQPLAWRWKPGVNIAEYKNQQETPEMVEIVQQDTGLQPIHFIGSGCIMFPAGILSELKKPWFKETFHPETYERFAHMDTMFCWSIFDQLHIPVYCDTDIKIQHLHDMPIDDSFQHRFDDWMDGLKADPQVVQLTKYRT